MVEKAIQVVIVDVVFLEIQEERIALVHKLQVP
jgi:hypothetical protein